VNPCCSRAVLCAAFSASRPRLPFRLEADQPSTDDSGVTAHSFIATPHEVDSQLIRELQTGGISMHSDCVAFTGRVARLVPLPAERPAACPFNAAKLPGVRQPHVLSHCALRQLALRTAYEDTLHRCSRLVTRLLRCQTCNSTHRFTQVSGFWLRGESLANLVLLAQPCGAPLLQVRRGVYVPVSEPTGSS